MAGVNVLIPAAGAATRMRGGDKLLELVGGTPQLRRAVEAARRCGATKVWVTLRPGDAARGAVLDGSWAKRIEVPDWVEGMAASLRVGTRAADAQKADALLVLLPDLPEIEARDLVRFVEAHRQSPESVLRATTHDGRPGHPVLLPRRLFPMLVTLKGDAGARDMLADETVLPIPLEGERAVTDLDTPEAWESWRARTGR